MARQRGSYADAFDVRTHARKRLAMKYPAKGGVRLMADALSVLKYRLTDSFAVPARLILVAASVTACSEEPREDIQLIGRLQLGEELARYSPHSWNDSLGLFGIRAILLSEDTLAIADSNDRLILMASELNGWRIVGRPGSGPGEFLRPDGIARVGRAWVVADRGNGRITWFDEDSIRDAQLTSMRGSGIAATKGGAILYPKRSEDAYARLLDVTGQDHPWAARAWPPTDDQSHVGSFPGFEKDFIAVDVADTTFILDGDSLVLRKYTPEGDFVEQRALPLPVRNAVMWDAGAAKEMFGGRQATRYTPAVTGLAVTQAGLLVVALPFRQALEPALALLVDPRTWTACLVDAGAHRWLTNAQRGQYFVSASNRNIAYASYDGSLGIFALPQVCAG